MLNRTNLTLSALSNRLNLGTRSLVLNTGVNTNGQTLRIRTSSHDRHVMRSGIEWNVAWFHAPMKYDISPRPGSMIPGIPQRPVRCGCPVASQVKRTEAAARAAKAKPAAAAATAFAEA